MKQLSGKHSQRFQMKKIINLPKLALCLLFVLPVACTEDFLDEKPKSFLNPENTFVDAQGLQTALDAALRMISRQINGGTSLLVFNVNMSDAAVIGATDKQDAFVDLRRYATPQNSRNNDAGRARAAYENGYLTISQANTVIDYIDNPDWPGGKNDPERNHLLGSAYFVRAFQYMQQTMQFGNCAFSLNVTTTSRQDFKAFTMQSVWDQMILDLEWAAKHVKPSSLLAKGQVPNAAVKILLAKYYMINLRFAEAEQLMDSIINSGEYKLFTDADIPSSVRTVQIGNNNNPLDGTVMPGRSASVPVDAVNYLHYVSGAQRLNNPESIWIFPNVFGIEGNENRAERIRAFGPNFVSTNQGIKAPTGINGINVTVGTGTNIMKWGRSQGIVRPTNYSQYDIWYFNGEVDRQDYRHKPGNWFEMSDVYYDADGLKGTEWYLKPLQLYSESGALLCNDTVRCWFGYPLYKMWSFDDMEIARQTGGHADNFIYRLAEVYLLRAEARFWQDNIAGATADLNVIRQRANAKHLYTTSDVAAGGIGAILDERNRELYGEEYRHDELVRISVILAKSGKPCYNGKTYSVTGNDLALSLSNASFYYDRIMEKNTFFRDEVPWVTYPSVRYTMDPKHIFWPIFENYLVGNVDNVLNQTPGYDGSEKNVPPLVHVVQPPGEPNIDPMEAIGER